MNEQSLFIEAVEKEDPAERAAFLDRACSGVPGLRERIERLLARHDRAAVEPGGPLPSPAVTVDLPPVAERPGTVIGPYKLVEVIGEGGMGTVFLAQQHEPVRRLVAVKLIKAGMDSRQVVARFEAERQALALMDHPNIARVLDAGATPSGRPYFVMDLVKGVPITKYCDEHRLTPRQRLELFVPVCQAVQHAHRKGIIHRDIKPSNVLVALYDDKPVVKVIDFGVAKATGQPLTEKTLVTGFGAIVGTLEYMSPEQATFNQLDIDTRSDIYSLGALLYELLAGNPPFTKKDLEAAGLLETLRVIREREPTKPSTKLSTAEGLRALAASRGTEPAKLRKLVRGELDWIVMKALEKDRDRRYETADAFALDLRRYLADEVVTARRPSVGYRLRKVVRRNKGPAAATVALALSLLAGAAAVAAVQVRADRNRAAREARAAANVAAAVRDVRERADEAWAVTDYPDRMQVATDAALAAIRRADEFAESESPGEATLADLESARREVDDLARHTRLVTAYEGNRQRYLNALSFGADLTTQVHLGNSHREALGQFGLDPIGGSTDEVARSIAASRVRDTLLGMLLEWQPALLNIGAAVHRDPRRSDLPTDAGLDWDRLGQVIRSARQLCGGAYARWQELLDRNDVPGLVTFAASPDGLSFRSTLVRALGRDLMLAKQYEPCRTFLRAALDHYPNDVWLHVDLATACEQTGRTDGAEALRHFSAACALRPNVAGFYMGLGRSYENLGSYDHAAAAYRRVIALSPDYGHAYYQLGVVLASKADWDGAIAALRESNRHCPNDPWGRDKLGEALLRARRYDEAIAEYREAVRIDPNMLVAHVGLGDALLGAGRYAEALEVRLDILRRHPDRAKDPGQALRYHEARRAMVRAYQTGANAPSPAEQPAYRKQAHELLAADLDALRKVAGAERTFVHQWLQAWLRDPGLAPVRDAKGLGQLPPDERAAWTKLWADIRELRDQTVPAAGAPKADK